MSAKSLCSLVSGVIRTVIAQDKPHIELYQRQDQGHWLLTVVKGLDTRLRLDAAGCELVLAEVYERVALAQ